MRMTQAQRDSAWACGREVHPGGLIGEKATPEQQRVCDAIRAAQQHAGAPPCPTKPRRSKS